jgi:hypothetical protein
MASLLRTQCLGLKTLIFVGEADIGNDVKRFFAPAQCILSLDGMANI